MLPASPNYVLGDARLGSIAVHLGLRDLPRPTGPANEAIFVRVSLLEPDATTGREVGCTEVRHISGPHLDFALSLGLHRAVPEGSTGDTRRLLLEVYTTHTDRLPPVAVLGSGSPTALPRHTFLRDDPTISPAGVHVVPLCAVQDGAEASDGLLDHAADCFSIFQPLRSILTDPAAAAGSVPRALGWITATAVALTPLALALGTVRLRIAFKGFPVRPSSGSKPSSPYLQLHRRIGQERDVAVTQAAWCSPPRRSAGKRDDAAPLPPGTPLHISEPIDFTVPIVALLDEKLVRTVRSLADVRYANQEAMVRLQACDWNPEVEAEAPFGYLDVRLGELLDPALVYEHNAAFLDAPLTSFGGQPGASLSVLRIVAIELGPLHNPLPEAVGGVGGAGGAGVVKALGAQAAAAGVVAAAFGGGRGGGSSSTSTTSSNNSSSSSGSSGTGLASPPQLTTASQRALLAPPSAAEAPLAAGPSAGASERQGSSAGAGAAAASTATDAAASRATLAPNFPASSANDYLSNTTPAPIESEALRIAAQAAYDAVLAQAGKLQTPSSSPSSQAKQQQQQQQQQLGGYTISASFSPQQQQQLQQYQFPASSPQPQPQPQPQLQLQPPQQAQQLAQQSIPGYGRSSRHEPPAATTSHTTATYHPALAAYSSAPTLQSLQPGTAASGSQERISSYLRTSQLAGDMRSAGAAAAPAFSPTQHALSAFGLHGGGYGASPAAAPFMPSPFQAGAAPAASHYGVGAAASSSLPSPTAAPAWYPTHNPAVGRVLGTARQPFVGWSTSYSSISNNSSGSGSGSARPPFSAAAAAVAAPDDTPATKNYAAAAQEATSAAVLGLSMGSDGGGSSGAGISSASRASTSGAANAAISAARNAAFVSGKTTGTVLSGQQHLLALPPMPAEAAASGAASPSGGGGGAGGALTAATSVSRPPANSWAASIAATPSSSSSTSSSSSSGTSTSTSTSSSTALAPPQPAPPLPTHSSFKIAGREALEAATRHTLELFNAMLKNAHSLGVGNGEWVTAFAQQLESGVLGLARPPPRDLLVSAAVSLGLTRVLESLEFVHSSTLAMDVKVVEDAQRAAMLQMEAERRTAAARDPHGWWRVATGEAAGGGSAAAAAAAAAAGAIRANSLKTPTAYASPGGALTLNLPSLADTTVDDIPLSEYTSLRDAASRSLSDLVSRWPSNVLEEVGAPGQLREFLLAASGPMESAKAASAAAQATLLREYDANHAEALLLRAKLAQARAALDTLEQESTVLRQEMRKSRDTLGVTVDRMRAQLVEHASKVAEYEGVTWTGGGGGGVVPRLAPAGGSGATGGGLSRLVTTSELIALACVPNDSTTARQRRFETAKARAAATAAQSPMEVYQELLANVRADYERMAREVSEAGAARVALEAASGDTVFEAGVRDAGEAAAAAAGKERARLAGGGGGGGLGAEALTSALPTRMGLRQRLEARAADVQRCQEEQRRLSAALAQADTDITALHVRHHCSVELHNLKSYCRAVWNLNHEALEPMRKQRFLLAALGGAPYSHVLHTFLLARHPPLAARYTLGPALASPPRGGGSGSGQQQVQAQHQHNLYAEALGLTDPQQAALVTPY